MPHDGGYQAERPLSLCERSIRFSPRASGLSLTDSTCPLHRSLRQRLQGAEGTLLSIRGRRYPVGMEINQILPNLYVGSCPCNTSDIDELRDEYGVTGIVNVQTDDDMSYWNIDWPTLDQYYSEHGIAVRRVPIRDFSPETLRILLPNAVQALSELLAEGRCVLVHCNAGINRSPSTVITYLHWMLDWDLAKSVRHVMERRIEADPYMDAIHGATADWQERRS